MLSSGWIPILKVVCTVGRKYVIPGDTLTFLKPHCIDTCSTRISRQLAVDR